MWPFVTEREKPKKTLPDCSRFGRLGVYGYDLFLLTGQYRGKFASTFQPNLP